QVCKEQPVVVDVVARAGVASRADARLTAQRGDADARVIRYRGQPGVLVGRARLDERIGLEGVAIFDRLRAVVADELDAVELSTQDATELRNLVLVVGREDECAGHASSAAFCRAVRLFVPASARSSRASSSARSKGTPSAVPCTSMNLPEPVATTFMSVPARTASV